MSKPPDPFDLLRSTAERFHSHYYRYPSRYLATEGYRKALEEWLEGKFPCFTAYTGLKTYFSAEIEIDYHIKYISHVHAVMYGARVYFSDVMFNPMLREGMIIEARFPWSLAAFG